MTSPGPDDLFLVDNSPNGMSALSYLEEWSELSRTMDVATGYFEIGALLALGGKWRSWDGLRILMGSQTTGRTRALLAEALRQSAASRLTESLASERRKHPFLDGVQDVLDAMVAGRIDVRTYARAKFHAKAYITHSKHQNVPSSCLVGSSNFTRPGLSQNIELNVRVQEPAHVAQLQAWFDEHWEDGESITPELIEIVEPWVRERTPFEVYLKALADYFRGREESASSWERERSVIWPKLDAYQREGYQVMLRIARKHGGAFLCDGVGLGKTFVGLMLLERLVAKEGQRVILFAPKAAREGVWKPTVQNYLPDLDAGFGNLRLHSHTDLYRQGEMPRHLERYHEQADALIIDEAHFFRNKGRRADPERGIEPSMYRKLQHLISNPDGTRKKVFMLTATPINNSLSDFRNLVELFTDEQDDHFRGIGINSLRGHFVGLDRRLRQELADRQVQEDGENTDTNTAEVQQFVGDDPIFTNLVVQRSRKYAKRSQEQAGGTAALFPKREPPEVAKYTLRKSYGSLLNRVEAAFDGDDPLFTLALYYPRAYVREGVDMSSTEDRWEENRQAQVVALVRTQFLKRFESSVTSFEQSCWRLMLKILAFLDVHVGGDDEQRNRIDDWKAANSDVTDYARHQQAELGYESIEDDGDGDEDEDIVPPELRDAFGEPIDEAIFDLDAIREACFRDLDQVAGFLRECTKVGSDKDDKLKALKKILTTELDGQKVLIFTEFADTARYVARELRDAGITGVDTVDSRTKKDRRRVIQDFAPYYNDLSSSELAEANRTETRILISTDVLSEGLNLQDATRLINYDIHWNPVRLMQRIGRVDRRMNPDVEADMLRDDPTRQRGVVKYWNFLPPEELETLVRLYRRVSGKALVISKTLGVEGGAFLRPEDQLDPLREIQHLEELLDGTESAEELMRLALNDLRLAFENDPSGPRDLDRVVESMPPGIFSGRRHTEDHARGVFLCYRIPAPSEVEPDSGLAEKTDGPAEFTDEAGESRWYLAVPGEEAGEIEIIEDLGRIFQIVRCAETTTRALAFERDDLEACRHKVEKHIKNTQLKATNAPAGVSPTLIAWKELH